MKVKNPEDFFVNFASSSKSTVHEPEQYLVWLLGVARFMKILVCLRK